MLNFIITLQTITTEHNLRTMIFTLQSLMLHEDLEIQCTAVMTCIPLLEMAARLPDGNLTRRCIIHVLTCRDWNEFIVKSLLERFMINSSRLSQMWCVIQYIAELATHDNSTSWLVEILLGYSSLLDQLAHIAHQDGCPLDDKQRSVVQDLFHIVGNRDLGP